MTINRRRFIGATLGAGLVPLFADGVSAQGSTTLSAYWWGLFALVHDGQFYQLQSFRGPQNNHEVLLAVPESAVERDGTKGVGEPITPTKLGRWRIWRLDGGLTWEGERPSEVKRISEKAKPGSDPWCPDPGDLDAWKRSTWLVDFNNIKPGYSLTANWRTFGTQRLRLPYNGDITCDISAKTACALKKWHFLPRGSVKGPGKHAQALTDSAQYAWPSALDVSLSNSAGRVRFKPGKWTVYLLNVPRPVQDRGKSTKCTGSPQLADFGHLYQLIDLSKGDKTILLPTDIGETCGSQKAKSSLPPEFWPFSDPDVFCPGALM